MNMDLTSEITFLVMPKKRADDKPARSAENMPGWRVISAAIRSAIEASGLPVALIAEKTGLTRQYVYSMMAGTCNPSMDKIEDVFNALDLSFSDWINDRSLYGRDKKLHDNLQYILNKKGLNAVTIRNVIEGLLIRSTSKS